jgi:hypothetical protein
VVLLLDENGKRSTKASYQINLKIVPFALVICSFLFPLPSGYIPPEYAFEGVCSIKTDVFSFGILILEIITGKRTAHFYQYNGKLYNLVAYVSGVTLDHNLNFYACTFALSCHFIIFQYLTKSKYFDDRPGNFG